MTLRGQKKISSRCRATWLRTFAPGSLSQRDPAVDLLRDVAFCRHVLLERGDEQAAALGPHEHFLSGEHRVVVAALEDEVGKRERVALAGIERLTVDLHVAHAIAGRGAAIDR